MRSGSSITSLLTVTMICTALSGCSTFQKQAAKASETSRDPAAGLSSFRWLENQYRNGGRVRFAEMVVDRVPLRRGETDGRYYVIAAQASVGGQWDNSGFSRLESPTGIRNTDGSTREIVLSRAQGSDLASQDLEVHVLHYGTKGNNYGPYPVTLDDGDEFDRPGDGSVSFEINGMRDGRKAASTYLYHCKKSFEDGLICGIYYRASPVTPLTGVVAYRLLAPVRK